MRSEKINDVKFEKFYNELLEKKYVSDNLIKDLVLMLSRLCYKATGSAKKEMSYECKVFLAIYFVNLQNGSICFPLSCDELSKLIPEYSHDLIDKGIDDFYSLDVIYEKITGNISADCYKQDKPFVLYKKNDKKSEGCFLFPAKYFRAKLEIQEKINALFKSNRVGKCGSAEIGRDEIQKLNTQIKKLRKSDELLGYDFELNSEQAEAVLRAKAGENLFITGGAGTGKTTAVFYLLYQILSDDVEQDLYLVAPSGKAQDRLKESIQSAYNEIDIGKLSLKERIVFDKIISTESSTIHSLLTLSLKDDGFKYNKDNQFRSKSIFVIDEASMIDISLFASLLSAIDSKCESENYSRVFILGDENQLPSVESGAVLGNLLSVKSDSTVKLIKSNRQKDGTALTQVAKWAIGKGELSDDFYDKTWLKSTGEFCEKFSMLEAQRKKCKAQKTDYDYPIFAYDITALSGRPASRDEKANAVDNDILQKYFDAFYRPLYTDKSYELSLDIENLFADEHNAAERLKGILSLQKNTQILAANKEGFCGTKYLNTQMRTIAGQYVRAKVRSADIYNQLPPGSPVIITRNMKNINLYNGDNGMVVCITCGKGDEKRVMDYFVIEKKRECDSEASSGSFASIFRIGDYLLYPLSLIPSDAVELAYAITIHKSQGSGYNNILIFLPEGESSPLLNRQILYTAITRTQGNTYIVSSPRNFKAAQERITKRWTEIEV